MFKIAIVSLLALNAVTSLNLPVEFKRCKRSDPGVNECLKDAIQSCLPVMAKGLPEFKMDGIDVIRIPSLTIGEGTGAVHVVQNYKNAELHSLHNAKIESVESVITDDEFKLIVTASVDHSRLEAEYNLDGNILLFPITGNGTCTVKIDDMRATMELVGEMFAKKEKVYMELKKFDVNLEPGKVEFNFRNLFNGDAKLGEEMNKLLNDNWSDIFTDVKSGYEQAVGAIFMGYSNLIFKKVPYHDIFLL